MKNFTLALIAGMICVLACNINLQARPNYNKEVATMYGEANAKMKEAKCLVCHAEGDDKKVKNEYGKAFGKILDGKKVTDAAKIKEALEKVAKEKRADGKTYEEVIKAGEVPNQAH